MSDVAKIAVVDDRASLLDEFSELFQIELPGADVVTFETVDEALVAIESGESWSHWIVDIMMPRGNSFDALETEDGLSTGISLIQRLQSSPSTISGSIIAFTLRDLDVSAFENQDQVVVLQKRNHTATDVVVIVKNEIEEMRK